MTPTIDLVTERLNRGLSIAGAAKEIGVPWDSLARAEKGIGRPHPANALKIAAFYGFTVTEIWPPRERQAEAS